MGKQIIKTEFLCESFYGLNQMDRLEKNIMSLAKQPNIEAVISGGLDDDFVYGIHLKVYKRIPADSLRGGVAVNVDFKKEMGSIGEKSG